MVTPKGVPTLAERSFPRIHKALRFLLPDGWRAEVLDLSAVGLRLQTVVVLEPGTEIEGELVLEGERRIPLKAKVVWCTPPEHAAYVSAEIGLELIDPPPEYQRALTSLFADEP